MKEYNCPNCGAVLNVRTTDRVVKCEFCDSVIDLERSVNEISAEKALEIAQQIRNYVFFKGKICETVNCLAVKNNQHSEIINKKKNLVPNIWLKAVVIWIICIIFFSSIMNALLYSFDILPKILDVIFAGTIGYFIFFSTQRQKEKQLFALNEAEKSILLEKENINRQISELSADFDENFLPANIRDDNDAINFIINSLETERAYTLRQAISLWEDRKFYQKQIDESVSKKWAEQNKSGSSEKRDGAEEAAGAFVGAALGALGGTVVRKAIKEVMKHL